jgi:phage pi2 protein 07
MFYQINFEKRRDLVQDVIDRLTRLNAEQGAQYLQELESLHKKFNIHLDADATGVRYYPTNQNLKRWTYSKQSKRSRCAFKMC